MKKLSLLITTGLISSSIFAQLNGTYNIPGSYPNIASAIADLNLQGVNGPVVFNIGPGYTETAPAGGYTITATGTAANTIKFQATGGATITAYTGGTGTPGSGTNQDFIFRLVGSDYITFDGLTLLENPSNTGNALMEAGICFLKASATDGCQYNTIQNCFIKLSYENNASGSGPSLEGSKGIQFINAANGALTTAVTITSPSGSNSYNAITSCTIANTNYGIVLVGYSDVSPYANADYNNLVNNNFIYNFGGASGATNPAAGVRTQSQYSLTISNNLFNNNNPMDPGIYHPSTLRGIFTQNATNASVSILSNTLSVISGGTTSQLSVIENSSGASGTNNVVNISDNLLQYCGYTNSGTSGALYGIYNSAGASTVTISNNSIQSFTSSVSGNVYFIYNSGVSSLVQYISNSITNHTINTTSTMYFMHNSNSTPNSLIQNNTISTITKAGAGGTVYGYYNFGSPSGGTVTLTGNLFNSITLTGATTFYGIYHATSSTQTVSILSNTVTNVNGGSSTTYGIYYSFGSPSGIIAQNLVTGITAAGTIYGIQHNGGSTIINNNTVTSFTTSGSTLYGLYQSGGTTLNIHSNKITDLTSTNTNPNVSGLYISAGTTVNAYNNIIGDLYASYADATNAVNGVFISGGTNVNLYHNTVRLNASSTGTDFGTSAIYASTTPTVLLQNNIFINNSTPNGTGKTVAYRRSSATLSSYNTSSNKNIFYAGTPGAQNLIFSDGTNDYQTLSAYKTAVSPADAGSYTENTQFLSLTPSNANYLHVDGSVASLTESNGLFVPSVSVDIDGDIRQGFPGYAGTGTAPDIGADEYNGIFAGAANDIGVIALNSPASTGCYSASENVNVTVKNFGTNVQPNVSVTVWVSGPTSATLNAMSTGISSGATVAVSLGTINMSAAGTYTFKAFTNLSTDGDHTNDTIVVTRVVTPTATLPQQVDFTGFTGANLPSVFPGWYEASGTVPTGTTSSWLSQTGVGSSGNVTARVNLYTNTRKEWIIGPKIIPTANTVLKFDAAVTAWNSTTASSVMGSDDAVYVMVSTDCGLSYTPIYTINATNNLPPTLTSFVLPLSSYSNTPIIIGFYATDGTIDDPQDYDFHLDNINIYNGNNDDLVAASINMPTPMSNCFGNENVIVTVSNNGFNSATNFTVTAVLAGVNNATISTTYTNNLAPFTSNTVSVGNFNMSTPGTYTITYYITYPADADNSNDTVVATYNNIVLPFPMLETFDAVSPLPGLPSGWVADNGSASYDFTVRTTGSSIQHGAGNPPTQGICADLYSGNSTSWFEPPSIGTLPNNDVLLSFVYRIVNFPSYANPGGTATSITNNDSLNVYVSSNCGSTWNLVASINGSNHTPTNLFTTKQICLGTTYAGQNIKLRFVGKLATPTSADFWIDIDSIQVNTVNVILSNNSITTCENTNISISANGANSYTWNPGAVTGSTFVPNTSTSGNTTYTVVGEIAGCLGSNTVNVTVNPLPNVSVNSATICSGQTATLTASGATSYTWNTGATTNSIIDNPTTTTTYTVTGEDLGCTNTATAQVIVNPTPTSTIAVTDAVSPGCNNGSATVTVSGGTGGYTYSWTAPASSTTNVATNLNGTSGSGTSYTVIVTDANGCSTSQSFTVGCVTSIASISTNNGISVYPNPNNGTFVISTNSTTMKTIRVMDVTGRVMMNSQSNDKEVEMNITNYSRGIYVIEVESEKGIDRINVVKE